MSGLHDGKLVDALSAETIPICWGNPEVASEFNSARFLNYHEFGSEAALLRRIIELDHDDDAYREMLQQPWFVGGEPPPCTRRDLLLDWLETHITDARTPIARRRSPLVSARRLVDRWSMRKRYRSKVF